jgi:hypothetical protein
MSISKQCEYAWLGCGRNDLKKDPHTIPIPEGGEGERECKIGERKEAESSLVAP